MRTTKMKSAVGSFCLALATGLAVSATCVGYVSAGVAQKPLFLTGPGLAPNILFIPDTSESMQEGLVDGRVALDFENCIPGSITDPDGDCVAGARNPQSKASIVKRTGLTLIDDYMDQINLGLLSYQQSPASRRRDDFNSGGTVRWRLVERILDARYSTMANPNFYQPDSEQAWDSNIKTNRIPHPLRDNQWIFFNGGVVGYDWNTAQDGTPGLPQSDRVLFTEETGDEDDNNDPPEWFGHRLYQNLDAPDNFQNQIGGLNQVFMTDTLRQRGITSWGRSIVFLPLNQVEWRSTTAPGLGYLHVPIGGRGAEGELDTDHWNSLRTKLQPQRLDWDGQGNPMTDSEWPLIAAGLTPLEGTMLTARDYFLGQSTNFGNAQGSGNNEPIPESCDVNAAIWVTDGLPSVRSDGTALGQDPVGALRQASDAVATFYEDTDVPLYVIGFSMPPGVAGLFEEESDFVTDNPLDLLAEKGGTGTAFDAETEAELQGIMDTIFSQIIQEARGSAAAAAASTTSLQTNTALFLAGFDSTDWSGDLTAVRIRQREDADDDLVDETSAWSANEQLPSYVARNILTWVPNQDPDSEQPSWSQGQTVPFTEASFNDQVLSDHQIANLNRNPETGADDARGTERLRWLRGDQSQEGPEESNFRSRSTLIGDIVNSNPLYIHDQNLGYGLASITGGDSYGEFLRVNRENRIPIVMAAANDGKLHAFDARLACEADQDPVADLCVTDPSQPGREVFSVIPNGAYDGISELTSQTYDRRYYFDGSPRLGHVYDEDASQWRRIVVASLGAGGRSVIAVDIDTQEVLWELDSSHNDALGYVLGAPTLGKTASGDWVTVIPNGVESGSNGEGNASLFIVDTLTGELLKHWVPDSDWNDENNGMFAPLPLDVSGDRRIDRLYSGDLNGNLWRLDLAGDGPDDWSAPQSLRSGNSDQPLFRAIGPSDQTQSITVRPTATRDRSGLISLFFGTGRYYADSDNSTNIAPQSFYGVQDRDEGPVGRGMLQPQEIIAELEDFGFELRVTTDRDVSATQFGWYLDLVSPESGDSRGERVVEDAIIRGGNRVVFSTLIPTPSDNPCDPGGGTGWVMELDAFSGSRLSRSPWDLSGEGFGEESYVMIDGQLIPVSGIRSPIGIPTVPAVVEDFENPDREYKFVVGSDGDVWEMPDEERTGSGRQSWRQLR